MTRDSWFFKRWVPGLTISICNIITAPSTFEYLPDRPTDPLFIRNRGQCMSDQLSTDHEKFWPNQNCDAKWNGNKFNPQFQQKLQPPIWNKKIKIQYFMTCVFLLPLRIFWRTASPFPRFVDRNNHDFFPAVLQLSVIPFSPASFSPHQPHLTPGC